jgi:hypothetical protein
VTRRFWTIAITITVTCTSFASFEKTSAYAQTKKATKVCITSENGKDFQFIPVPDWASQDLCQDIASRRMPSAQPAPEIGVQLGCFVPKQGHFSADQVMVISPGNSGPCGW